MCKLIPCFLLINFPIRYVGVQYLLCSQNMIKHLFFAVIN